MEVFNGGATAEENLLAYDFAVENGLPVLGGNDAHHVSRVGMASQISLNEILNAPSDRSR